MAFFAACGSSSPCNGKRVVEFKQYLFLRAPRGTPPGTGKEEVGGGGSEVSKNLSQFWHALAITLRFPCTPGSDARAPAKVDANLEPNFALLGADVDKNGVEASDLAGSRGCERLHGGLPRLEQVVSWPAIGRHARIAVGHDARCTKLASTEKLPHHGLCVCFRSPARAPDQLDLLAYIDYYARLAHVDR